VRIEALHITARCFGISLYRVDHVQDQLREYRHAFSAATHIEYGQQLAAAIRHQFYTLPLPHFAEVYRNYFKCPKLYTLHNRSGELWSSLVALAAFFRKKAWFPVRWMPSRMPLNGMNKSATARF